MLARRYLGPGVCVLAFVLMALLIVLKRPEPANQVLAPQSAVPVPAEIYLGAYNPPLPVAGQVPEPQNEPAERELGRKLAIDGHYYEFDGVFPSRAEQADLAAGQIPMISWQPNGVEMADISRGRYDDLIRARATGLKNFGAPVFLRFAHEMNGDWYSWSPRSPKGLKLGNSVADYIAAWRRIHRLFAEQGVTNVAWVWCPNALDFPAGNVAMQYYPGDGYVDWVGVDTYNFGNAPGSKWLEFSTLLLPIYEQLPADKPVILAEFGSAEPGGDKAEWIADAVSRIRRDFHRVHAVVFFDKAEFGIATSPEARAAGRELAADPLFSAMPD